MPFQRFSTSCCWRAGLGFLQEALLQLKHHGGAQVPTEPVCACSAFSLLQPPLLTAERSLTPVLSHPGLEGGGAQESGSTVFVGKSPETPTKRDPAVIV